MEFIITEGKLNKKGFIILKCVSVPEKIEGIVIVKPDKLTLVANKEIYESKKLSLCT